MATTTLTSWALLLWSTLKARGYDPKPVFKEVGLDYTKLGDGQARFEALKMPQLWEAAVTLTGDEDLGVAVGTSWNPTTFHALGFAWLASDSLLEGFQRLHRYSHLVNNSLITRLDKVGTHYRFSMTTSEDINKVHPAGNDAGITAIIKMCRMLAGEAFVPVAMELARNHRNPGALEAYVGVSPEYNRLENVLLIDQHVADKSLATGNSMLAEANEQTIRQYLTEVDRNNVVGNVIAILIDMLPSGNASEEAVAGKMNLTLRTLQRKLKSENQSFKKLQNETREKLANSHIKNSQMSLTEIAYLLGFADQANFTRAYKRWTGYSPSSHRKELLLQKTA